MRLPFLASCSLILAACATAPVLPRSQPSDAEATPASAVFRDPDSAPALQPVPSAGARLADLRLADPDAPQGPPPPMAPPRPPAGTWRAGEVAMQGYFGASFLSLNTEGGSVANVNDDDVTFPTIGGGAQWKIAGDQIDFGVEGLLAFSWRGNVSAFAVGGGGAAVAVDINLLMFDLYGGPFVSMFLGDKTRIYAATGPLMRWTIYDQDGGSSLSSGNGDGFGFGYYARAGIEFALSRGTMIGLCARWTDVAVDLNSRLGDLDMSGFEALLTISQGF
jgi:hypothetical protein